jgi:hypothetical protein
MVFVYTVPKKGDLMERNISTIGKFTPVRLFVWLTSTVVELEL